MKKSNPTTPERDIHFYHICTDGENNGIVHTCDEDYRQAIIISVLCAHKSGVHMICYCHMSTHSHFVVWCESYVQAQAFSDSYKRDYARYTALKHGLYKVFRNVNATPIEVTDGLYLKNCISYVLLNPVAAGIVRRPEDYRWSSFEAYYSLYSPVSLPVCTMKYREKIKFLNTRADISDCKLELLENGEPFLKSFIDYRLVERLFGGRTEFYRSLALTNPMQEEVRYVGHTVQYNDNELFAEALKLTETKYGKADLRLLTKSEKYGILLTLRKKTGVKAGRMARVLRLNPKEVREMLGTEY